ncbi:MAG: cell wall hydrolase, partial [Lachnospiraceae bacterium]|nr:cell wall hydrolase [Lachnospiraceae bacterium]
PGDVFEGSDGTILVANKLGIKITKEDYECFLTILEAEAGDQGLKGLILVGNVIINRVKSPRYANDIQGVVFQKGQFSPVRPGGRYYTVTPDDLTREAVLQVLSGTDYSEGAEYFCCKTSEDSMFNTRLKFLFKYRDHYFYKK